MKYRGKVKSGLGEAAIWMRKARKVFKEKYDIEVYFGTLNVELEKEIIISEKENISPEEYGGIFNVYVEKCKVNRIQ